jgi:methionyl-tRNA formyltransferase
MVLQRTPERKAGRRRIAVAASSPFGADVLERLAAGHDLVQLLTRPDRPRGRGRRLAPTPAKEAAERLGIPVSQPARLDGTVELDADTVVVCAYGLLIPPALLDRALWLNVHPSLLPRWRGAAPVERALMAGDAETGVTIHRTVEALDAGPISAQAAFPVGRDDDAGAVYERAAALAAELLGEVLARARPDFTPQPEEGVTYADKIGPADRELDLARPAAELVDRVRALSPHIGARAVVDGRPLLVWKARVGEDGSFELLDVQPEGRRRMTYDEYLRGLR